MSRPERYAALQAVTAANPLKALVVDPRSLHDEGRDWSERHEGPKARHAALWRSIRAVHSTKSSTPPTFRWVPSHMGVHDLANKGINAMDWQGNRWADFFAKEGARQVRMPGSELRDLQMHIDEAMSRAKYLGWVAARVVASGRWEAVDENGKKERLPPTNRLPAVATAMVVEHALTPCGANGEDLLCVRCHRRAYTRGCEAPAVGRGLHTVNLKSWKHQSASN